jgi:hypothetical protein
MTESEKSEAEILRDMNETLKRMHKMPPMPHKQKGGKIAPKSQRQTKKDGSNV